MEFGESSDAFFTEDCHNAIKNAIATKLTSDLAFDSNSVIMWSKAIIDASLRELQSLNRAFKYVVTATFMQRCGAGFIKFSSTYWDVKYDGLCTVHWQNSTMQCTVTVYGFSLDLDPPDEEEGS